MAIHAAQERSLVRSRQDREKWREVPTDQPGPQIILLFIDKIIGQSLSQGLDLIQPDMYDEIRYTVDSTLGTDVCSWREIDLSQAILTIIDGTGNRVLFGLSLCRNVTYLRILRLFIIFMGASTLLIGQLPPWSLRPVAGTLLSIPTLIFKKLSVSYVQPLVKERMQSVNDANDDQGSSSRKSHDFVTQSIKSVTKFRNSIEGDVSTYLAEQFLILVRQDRVLIMPKNKVLIAGDFAGICWNGYNSCCRYEHISRHFERQPAHQII